jgi:membrane associated rhomboid family serine protease
MGAYMLLYPKAMVLALIPLFVILQVMVIPAPVFLGIWFLLQFFQGAMAITTTMATGVAWWAHIGGFVGGFLVAAVLRAVGETSPPVVQRLPHTERPTVYSIRRS